MGANSAIEWTHHTFNPWWGCQKVSPACINCYAETFAARFSPNLWGPGSERRFFDDKHWGEPLKWDRRATAAGERHRIFCASMADVFEDRSELTPLRARLYALIDATPHLDWLLLTKRPENAEQLWSGAAIDAWDGSESMGPLWRRNVWLGTTVENHMWAERRIDKLLENDAAVHFLSVEPMLDYIDLRPWLKRIDWVIVGGESGAHASPMDPRWVRSLRDQCNEYGTPFFFKQWGGAGVLKKQNGRVLDGRTWDEVPSPYVAAVGGLS
jgi:protein gp37